MPPPIEDGAGTPPRVTKWASAGAASPSQHAAREPCVAPTWHDVKRRGFRRRPDVWSVKTRQSEWATVYSRWRYLHGYLFAVGPPHHLLRRIKVPLIINSIVFGIVAADHIVESVSTSSGKGSINLFPKLSASVVANLTPIFQLSLLAVSLMLTQRVGRVYDRWLESRKNLSLASNWVVIASQRAAEWGDPKRADAVARWAVAWMWLMVGWLSDEPDPPPVLEELMSSAELDALAKARKPRTLAFSQLCRLLGGSKEGIADFMTDKLGDVWAVLEATKRQGIPSGVANLSTGFILYFTLLYPLTALPSSSSNPHDVDLKSVLFTLALEYFLYIIICVLFLGADEMANSMEDCFLHLPLKEIARGVTRDVQEVLDAVVAMPGVDGIGKPAALMAGSGAVWLAAVERANQGGVCNKNKG